MIDVTCIGRLSLQMCFILFVSKPLQTVHSIIEHFTIKHEYDDYLYGGENVDDDNKSLDRKSSNFAHLN
jgi:hypothetical protein